MVSTDSTIGFIQPRSLGARPDSGVVRAIFGSSLVGVPAEKASGISVEGLKRVPIPLHGTRPEAAWKPIFDAIGRLTTRGG